MAEKHYRFFEVLNSGAISKIKSPNEATAEAKWILKEEYFFPCNSYAYSEFYFIDSEGEKITMQVADAEVNRMYISGVAEDYQLVFDLKDKSGNSNLYRLHDDIRYNYLPFIGPKAFTPKYMDWDRENPEKEIVYYLTELEKLGFEVFDEEFKMVAEIRDISAKYNRLRRDSEIASAAARVIDCIEIKEGTERLEPYAIEAFTSLKKLVLPESITHLEEYALYSFSLEEIHCKAKKPPYNKFFVFGENRSYPELTIYVPRGTAEEYAKEWGFNGKPRKEFTFIECDFDKE